MYRVTPSLLLKRAPPSLANGLPGRDEGRRRADGEEERHCSKKSWHVSGRQPVKEGRKHVPDAGRQRETDGQANGPRHVPWLNTIWTTRARGAPSANE